MKQPACRVAICSTSSQHTGRAAHAIISFSGLAGGSSSALANTARSHVQSNIGLPRRKLRRTKPAENMLDRSCSPSANTSQCSSDNKPQFPRSDFRVASSIRGISVSSDRTWTGRSRLTRMCGSFLHRWSRRSGGPHANWSNRTPCIRAIRSIGFSLHPKFDRSSISICREGIFHRCCTWSLGPDCLNCVAPTLNQATAYFLKKP